MEADHDLAMSQPLAVGGGVGQLGMAHRSDGPASSLRMFGHVHRAVCSGVLISSFLDILEVGAGFEGSWGGWPARHGTSIRWASLLA